MSDLKAAIRIVLAGSSSQKPVESATLNKLGKPDAVMFALESLRASREINTALVIRGGKQSVLCWLTGAVGLPNFNNRLPPQRTLECAGTTARGSDASLHSIKPKPTKEQTMSTTKRGMTGGRQSPITVAIVELIGEQPGIGRESLIEQAVKRTPGATKQHALKSIGNLIHVSGKIRAEGGFGKRNYFLKGAANVAKPSAVVGASSLAKKPFAAKAAPTQDDAFRIVLTESGLVQIGSGDTTLLLDAQQATRLHRFIGRIYLPELPA